MHAGGSNLERPQADDVGISSEIYSGEGLMDEY